MERGDVEQVAWYTSMLPADQQVPCYASFLTNINDRPQREHAIHLAEVVGLDTFAIAGTTLALIRWVWGYKISLISSSVAQSAKFLPRKQTIFAELQVRGMTVTIWVWDVVVPC